MTTHTKKKEIAKLDINALDTAINKAINEEFKRQNIKLQVATKSPYFMRINKIEINPISIIKKTGVEIINEPTI